MQGKTHLVVGTSLALALLHPATMTELVAGTGTAAVGSIISDIDERRAGRRNVSLLTGIAVVVIAGCVIVTDRLLNLGILVNMRAGMSSYKLLVVLAFLFLCTFGIHMKHRAFMHSLLGMALLTICVALLFPSQAAYFLIGFATHLFLDFLNRRGEKLLFPYGKKYSLQLCRSNGKLNLILFAAGSVALLVVMLLLLKSVGGS